MKLLFCFSKAYWQYAMHTMHTGSILQYDTAYLLHIYIERNFACVIRLIAYWYNKKVNCSFYYAHYNTTLYKPFASSVCTHSELAYNILNKILLISFIILNYYGYIDIDYKWMLVTNGCWWQMDVGDKWPMFRVGTALKRSKPLVENCLVLATEFRYWWHMVWMLMTNGCWWQMAYV